MTRLNKFYVFIGRKGSGKTTIAMQLADASGKKICVVDTDDHPSYSDFTEMTIDKLHLWKSGNIKVITSDPLSVYTALNKLCANVFVIFEDTAKYISKNVQNQIRAFIIDHRKRNFDVAMMFHFLDDVPPYICKQYNYIILFKTGDNLENKLPKFANWHNILKKALKVRNNKSDNYCETIDIND